MANNQYTKDRPVLDANTLSRELMKRHKEAGQLPPGQHVFTIDDVRELQRLYGVHMAKTIMNSKGKNKFKSDLMTTVNKRVLSTAHEEYKKLNKTP